MLRDAIELAGDDQNTPGVSLAHLYLGDVHYAWNDLKRAVHEQRRAIDEYRPIKIFGSMQLGQAYDHLALTLTALGDVGAASKALDDSERSSEEQQKSPVYTTAHAGFRAAVSFMCGDAESASRWADSIATGEASMPIETPFLASYLLDVRKGSDIAEEQLKAEYAFFAAQGLAYVLIAIRLRQALNSVDPKRGLEFLADALRMAKPQGLVRVFVDFGISLAPLLREAISHGDEPDYARKLLDLIQAEESQRQKRAKGVPIPDSSELLGPRELEVLDLIAQGLSNRQIADRLTISLNTAKTHVHRISYKLQARSRTQAVTRARELKII